MIINFLFSEHNRYKFSPQSLATKIELVFFK